MKKIDRILISQDDALFEQIKGDISQFQSSFRNLVTAYKELNLGTLTPSVFEEIKSGQAFKSVRRYEAALEKSLDDTKVVNPTLRNNLLQGTGEVSGAFIRAAKVFLDTVAKPTEWQRKNNYSHKVLSVEFLNLSNDGELTISEENSELILEAHCRYYLETEEQKELYDAVQGLCDNYKTFWSVMKRLQFDMDQHSNFSGINDFVMSYGSDPKPDIEKIVSAINWPAMKAKYKN